MTRYLAIPLAAFLFSSITLISCANLGSSSSSSSGSTDVFASPKAVLENLETEFSVSSGTRNARSAGAVDPGSTLAVNSSNIVGTIESSTETRRLTGQVSLTTGILNLMKNNASKTDGIAFGATTSFSGREFFEKAWMTVIVSSLRVDYSSSENAAYVYSKGTAGKWSYRFVLKCTKNAINTLDTELYMEMAGNQTFYSKFTSTSSQKVKFDYNLQMSDAGKLEDYWAEVIITASGLSGYRYANPHDNIEVDNCKLSKMAFVVDTTTGGYCGVKFLWGSKDATGKDETASCDINDTNGYHLASDGGSSTWAYSLHCLNIPDSYVIARSSDEAYTLKASASAESGKPLTPHQGVTTRTSDGSITKDPDAFWYEIAANVAHEKQFSFKDNALSDTLIASLASRADTLYSSFPSSKSEPTTISTLKAMLP